MSNVSEEEIEDYEDQDDYDPEEGKKTWKNAELPLQQRWELLEEELYTGMVPLSISSLKAFHDSPRRYMHHKLKIREETDAMLTGSVFHAMVLEPENIDGMYFTCDVYPSNVTQKALCDAIAAGYEGKEAWEQGYKSKFDQEKYDTLRKDYASYIEAMQKSTSAKFVKPNIWQQAERQRDAVMHTVEAREMIEYTAGEKAANEEAITWEFKGYPWRGKADRIDYGNLMVIDLKQFGKNAAPNVVRKKKFYERIDWQLAAYAYAVANWRGMKWGTYIIAMDSQLDCCVNEVTEDEKRTAMKTMEYVQSRFIECCQDRRWRDSYSFWKTDGDKIY